MLAEKNGSQISMSSGRALAWQGLLPGRFYALLIPPITCPIRCALPRQRRRRLRRQVRRQVGRPKLGVKKMGMVIGRW